MYNEPVHSFMAYSVSMAAIMLCLEQPDTVTALGVHDEVLE